MTFSMILRIATLFTTVCLFSRARTEVAPEITTVAEGYNVIAKLPCIGCPFLYQDTSKGSNEPWTQREDQNALLLNISLPYDSAHLSINTASLLNGSPILPRIYANQVLLDASVEDIAKLIDTNQLDHLGGGYFGISYRYSLQRIKRSSALVFHFDVFELWTNLLSPAVTVPLRDPAQKVLEILLLPRPLLSAGDPGHAFEIVRVELVERGRLVEGKGVETVRFQEWDDHGMKGTPSHLMLKASDSLISYITSGAWALFLFIMAVIALFVVLFLFCIIGTGGWGDEYGRAQHKKRRAGTKGTGSWGSNDIEKARGRFKTAEELGMRGGGRVVSLGKSD